MGAPTKTFADHVARLNMSDPDACWPWPGSDDGQGYGQLKSNNKNYRAHKYFYEHLVGPVPDGMVLDHTCHDPSVCGLGNTCPHRKCCNPKHLNPTTNKRNILRGGGEAARNAAKTHCTKGHEFTPENTYSQRNGKGCRTCRNASAREARARQKLATADAVVPRVRPKKTHCVQGHEFTETSTYSDKNGHRSCKVCRQHSMRKFRQK